MSRTLQASKQRYRPIVIRATITRGLSKNMFVERSKIDL